MPKTRVRIVGEVRHELIRLALQGFSARDIDKILGLGKGTAHRWLKRNGYR